jgi:hypothetical protein
MESRWLLRTTAIEEILHARDRGFDDIEPELAVLMQFDAGAFSRFVDAVREAQVRCEVFETPLPREIRVTEKGFNIFSWTEYLKRALDRAAQLGCKVIAWADGPSRMLPDEGDTSVQKEHFSQFLFMLCDAASRFGISVCIEPASPKVTNFLTTPEEIAEIIESVGQPNLSMLLSSAYVAHTRIALEEIQPHAALLRHVHLEHPDTRRKPVPPAGDDGFDYREFITALKEHCFYTGPYALPAGVEPQWFSAMKMF